MVQLLIQSMGRFLFLSLLLAAPAHAAILAPDTPEAQASAAPMIDVQRDNGADALIAERVAGIYAEVPSLTGVTAQVDAGVITLSGTVTDSDAATRAEAIASRVSGVVTVENNIERDVSVDSGLGLGPLSAKITGFSRMLPLIGAAILVAFLIAGAGYALASLTALWRRVAPNSFLAELIASAIRFVFVIGGLVIALDMIGAGALLGAVLGGAGVVGIALGFAMRDTVENYVASLMLSVRQPFRANDHVVIDAHEGRVIRLTSRATVLMTMEGNHLRIPNGNVFKAVIINYTRNPQRRFEFELGIDADDDPDAARALGREVLSSQAYVLSEPAPEVYVANVGDSNIVLTFLGWIDQREADFNKARSRAIAATKKALELAGFALPEPIYRLRIDSRSGPLSFANIANGEVAVGEAAATPTPPATPPPSPPQPSAGEREDAAKDVAPDEEVARMVEAERADHKAGEKDLLDSDRPVE